jgi:hypothetical protein
MVIFNGRGQIMDLKEQFLMEQLDRLESIEEQIMFTTDPANRMRLEREWVNVRTNIFQLAKTLNDDAWVMKRLTKYMEFWTKTYNDLQTVYDNCSNRTDDPRKKFRWKQNQEKVLERIKELEKLPDTFNIYLQGS